MSRETRSQRLDLVLRAVDHVESHLLESPSVEEIAAASGVSRTHLQRVFDATLGESVGAYVRRRRLCRAMDALLSGDRRVLDIALEHGFGSQEAFTRAFSAHFGIAPASFRRHGDRFSDLVEPRLTRERLELRMADDGPPPSIRARDAETFVGVEARFVWAMSDGTDVRDVVPDAWRRFDGAWPTDHPAPRFSLTYGAAPEKQSRGDEMMLLVGVRVDDPPSPLPDGLVEKHTRATEFAVFDHAGPGEAFSETVTHALLHWLPKSGYEIDAYAAQVRSFGTGTEGRDEYWLPIVPSGEPARWRRRDRSATGR